jgi:hypothetical protein
MAQTVARRLGYRRFLERPNIVRRATRSRSPLLGCVAQHLAVKVIQPNALDHTRIHVLEHKQHIPGWLQAMRLQPHNPGMHPHPATIAVL